MIRWLTALFFVLPLLVAQPGTAAAKFRALLIGINYEGADPLIKPLDGAVNDIQDMRKVMVETLGISSTDIRVLTERQATRAGILNSFREWLVNGTAAGDSVFVHIAGHGMQIPDTIGSQVADPVKQGDMAQQKLSEALVPYDTAIDKATRAVANVISDNELNQFLRQLADRKVTLLLDICHSGGVTRNVVQTDAKKRSFTPPWDPRQTRIVAEAASPATPSPGVVAGDGWQPDYTFIAAARYFQSAYEYPPYAGHNGALSYAVLELLRANPRGKYTNQQVLDYARMFIHQRAGIPKEQQEPIFHGPGNSGDQPFVLFEQASSSAAPVVQSAAPIQPATPAQSKSVVRVTGERDAVATSIRAAIDASTLWRSGEQSAEAIIVVRTDGVDLANAVGHRIKSLARGTRTADEVMKALEAMRVVRELAALDNPAAASAVELWIDQPGKTEFRTSDKVTLYYRVNSLPSARKAYLTLVNISPSGSASILYPSQGNFGGTRAEKLYTNAEVEIGKIHSIPKTAQALQPSRNVGIDLRLTLEEGQEFFKAIVTAEPVAWDTLSLSDFQSRFGAGGAQRIIAEAAASTQRTANWATATLRVDVTR